MNNVGLPQEDLLQINSTFSKIVKRWYGKGPEHCFATFRSDMMVIHVSGFITAAEKALMEKDSQTLAYQFRYSIMEKIYEEFNKEMYDLLEISFSSYHSDWNFATDTGIILFQNDASGWTNRHTAPGLKEKLMNQIMDISKDVHQAPANIDVQKLSHKIIAVRCQDALLPIEKLLFSEGYSDILHQQSEEIKKVYRRNRKRFEAVIGRGIEDIYMIWNYEYEECYLFFCLV
ncbi:hypothetical protein GCM10008986_13220 [Salinibacillus aidingensis]|uniref:Na+-translocating membrane potential-generating system MpsC domain-containing protein n=1 Tax=Salinibacillus aidingensis TaxID=237684 RepID=A0ABP3KX59_9BACI